MAGATQTGSDAHVFDRTRQFDRKRAALIRAAARSFHEHGYSGTTLDMIAASLGVTKKALYRYVSGKLEILYEIFLLWTEVQTEALTIAEAVAGPPSEKIRVYARSYVAGMFENLVPTDRLVGELHILPEEQRREIQAHRKKNDDRLAALFREGQGKGMRSHDPKLAVHTLNGAIDWIFKWYKEGGKLTPAQATDEILEILMTGFLSAKK